MFHRLLQTKSNQFISCSHQINFFDWHFDSDKLFVIITQFGKVGNLIEIRRDIASKDDPSSSVYNIRLYLSNDMIWHLFDYDT